MKKTLIPVILVLALGVGALIYAMSISYSQVQYDKDALLHVLNVRDSGELTAEYLGQTIRVLGSNVDRIKWIVTISERERLFKKPEYAADTAIKLSFSDGAAYIIANDPSVNDSVFILYSYNRRNLWFRIHGYKSFDWTVRAISPEGINSANEAIETTAEGVIGDD